MLYFKQDFELHWNEVRSSTTRLITVPKKPSVCSHVQEIDIHCYPAILDWPLYPWFVSLLTTTGIDCREEKETAKNKVINSCEFLGTMERVFIDLGLWIALWDEWVTLVHVYLFLRLNCWFLSPFFSFLFRNVKQSLSSFQDARPVQPVQSVRGRFPSKGERGIPQIAEGEGATAETRIVPTQGWRTSSLPQVRGGLVWGSQGTEGTSQGEEGRH